MQTQISVVLPMQHHLEVLFTLHFRFPEQKLLDHALNILEH